MACLVALLIPRFNCAPVDFIEIGTSDFATLTEKAAGGISGISVDAVAHYLFRLPAAPNVRLLNKFISSELGQPLVRRVYYVSSEDVFRHNLDYNLRGCSQAEEPHPVLLVALRERGLEWRIRTVDVEVWSFRRLMHEANVSSVAFVKVDAERHTLDIAAGIVQACSIKESYCPTMLCMEVWGEEDARLHFNSSERYENYLARFQRRVGDLVGLGYTLLEHLSGGGDVFFLRRAALELPHAELERAMARLSTLSGISQLLDRL